MALKTSIIGLAVNVSKKEPEGTVPIADEESLVFREASTYFCGTGRDLNRSRIRMRQLAAGFVIGAGVGAGGAYIYLSHIHLKGQGSADTSELV